MGQVCTLVRLGLPGVFYLVSLDNMGLAWYVWSAVHFGRFDEYLGVVHVVTCLLLCPLEGSQEVVFDQELHVLSRLLRVARGPHPTSIRP